MAFDRAAFYDRVRRDRAESILAAHDGWMKVNSEEGAFTTEFLVPALPVENA